MCSVYKFIYLCVMCVCVASCGIASPISHVTEPVIHKVPNFSIAYQHPELINPMDKQAKVMETLLIKDYYNRQVSAKQAQGSPTSPWLMAPLERVIAPHRATLSLPLKRHLWEFDYSLTSCYKKAYSCLREWKQNKATESLLKKPLYLWIGGNRDEESK